MSSLRHLVEAQHRWPVAEGTNAWPNNTQFGLRRSKDDSRSEARGDLLRRTIETEVIPQLLLAHRAAMDEGLNLPQRATLSDAYPRASEIAELARLVVHQDASTALTYVDTVSARGVPLDAIFINLLAPTARLLGELWNEDICNFVDVTIGLSRLQQVLHELSAGSKAKKVGSAQALLVSLPGDQHGFGVFMLQELFRCAGWQVSGGVPVSNGDLIDLARVSPFDMIGLSVSCDTSPDDLFTLIRILRRNAKNRSCQILVGGRFFIEHPELVERVGADATATDGRLAVCQLSSFLDTKPVRC
jgi:methanogenic corrinoid protein MtbC1